MQKEIKRGDLFVHICMSYIRNYIAALDSKSVK